MTEEKNEDIKKPVDPAAKEAETKKVEAPAEPKAEAAAVSVAAPAKAPEEKKAVKVEKPANCTACNKSIKKKRCYYRNSKYYCSKRCWQTALKKEKAAAASAAPAAPEAATQ